MLANSGAAWRVVSDAQFGSKGAVVRRWPSGGSAAYIGSVTGEIFRQGGPWSRVCCNNLPDITGMTSSSFGLLAVGFTVGGSILQSNDGMTWNTAVDGASTLLYGVAATTGKPGPSGCGDDATQHGWSFVANDQHRCNGLIRAVAGTTAGYYAAGKAVCCCDPSERRCCPIRQRGRRTLACRLQSPTEAWAVGDVGTIYQFNGTAW